MPTLATANYLLRDPVKSRAYDDYDKYEYVDDDCINGEQLHEQHVDDQYVDDQSVGDQNVPDRYVNDQYINSDIASPEWLAFTTEDGSPYFYNVRQ